MLGYIFNTRSEAEFAKRVCDEAAGFPVSTDNVTTEAVTYSYSELDNFWYIAASDFTSPLDVPTEFTITHGEPI